MQEIWIDFILILCDVHTIVRKLEAIKCNKDLNMLQFFFSHC